MLLQNQQKGSVRKLSGAWHEACNISWCHSELPAIAKTGFSDNFSLVPLQGTQGGCHETQPDRDPLLVVMSVILNTTAHSQSSVKADVPFAFKVGAAELPAGTYAVNTLGSSIIEIRTLRPVRALCR